MFLFLALIPFIGMSYGGPVGSSYIFFAAIDFLLGLAIPIGRKTIDNMAKNRARAFEKYMRESWLLDINRRAFPTAHWNIRFRDVLTHYSINMNANGKGTVTPKYAEEVELILEIHDGLSGRTAHTIRVNLPLIVVPTTQPLQMVTMA